MTAPESEEIPPSESTPRWSAFDEEQMYTIHPVLFGWIVLVFAFISYQLVGGIAAYTITGGDAKAHITATRLLTMASQVLFLLAPALLLVKMQPWTYKRLLHLRSAGSAQIFLAIFAIAAIQIPIQGYIQAQEYALYHWLLPESWLPQLEVFKQSLEDMYGVIATAHSPGELALVLLVVAITPAVCEELLFRGIVFGSFRRVMGPGGAIALSGAAFGLFHLNPVTFLPLTALGMLLAWMTWKSGSIIPAIIAHAANNTIAIISLYFLGGVDPAIGTESNGLPGTALAIASLVSAAVFIAATGMFRTVSQASNTGLE